MTNFDSRSHRKRCRRFDEAGHAHALTFSCFRRQPLLSKDRSRQWLGEAIEKARKQHQFHLRAWVIMPEHVPLLICPMERDYSRSLILKTLKQSVSKRALFFLKKQVPEFLVRLEDRQPNGMMSDRFWQRGGGFDGNLTKPKTIWAMIDDIHANPVRRGLCERPTDWDWSSAREYELPGTGKLRRNRESLPQTASG